MRRLTLDAALIESKSIPEPNTGCWLWTGWLSRYGYGQIHVRPKTFLAHRLSWAIHRGPAPDELCVCHKCDTPACVNPEHLFLGTKGDNAQDMLAKGRSASGASNRLTDELVREMRTRMALGASQSEMSKAFGVSQCLVSMILHRKRWAHVD